MRTRVKKFIMVNGVLERRTVERGQHYYTQGPKPSTPRGKRRHAARNAQQKAHAEAVWNGKS